MPFRSLALFFTVLIFAIMIFTCGLLLMNACPDVLAICSSSLGFFTVSVLGSLLVFLTLVALHMAPWRSEPPSLEEFVLSLDRTPGFSRPLFLVNEVYRL